MKFSWADFGLGPQHGFAPQLGALFTLCSALADIPCYWNLEHEASIGLDTKCINIARAGVVQTNTKAEVAVLSCNA